MSRQPSRSRGASRITRHTMKSRGILATAWRLTLATLVVILYGAFMTSGVYADPFPANNERACTRGGGTFAHDTGTTPPTSTCTVSETTTTPARNGYTVTTTSVLLFIKQGGSHTALGYLTTMCHDPQGTEVPFSNSNCQP
jgi:hypothetical protein